MDMIGETVVTADVPAQQVQVRPHDHAPPTTTGEEDRQAAGVRLADVERATRISDALMLKVAGQRRVNITWEMTQALIAATTVGTVLYVGAMLTLAALVPNASERIVASSNTSFLFLSNMASLIVGFYFGRTNHQRTGGVGGNDAVESR